MTAAIRFSRGVFAQALHHFHEVAPAIVLEAPHMNAVLALALLGVLLLVFAAQVLIGEAK